MKRNFWRKTAAFTLALTLVTGAMPANTAVQDLFSGAVLTAHAEVTDSGECGDNVTWSLEDGVLTISGTGEMNYSTYSAPWFNYYDIITEIVIGNGVTDISSTAFFGCEGVTSITIPDSVESIGSSAFGYCSSLTSITIPSGVTNIEDQAFDCCESLTEIVVDQQNPSYCSDNGVLFSISKRQLHTYPAGKPETAYAIPDTVTSIDKEAFSGCSNLKSVTIPDSVTSIGERAFSNCSSLESVTIPNSVTSIGYATFYGCNLKSVTIPASVTSIGQYAFGGCNALKAVIVERAETLTALRSNAFVYHDYEAGSTAILPDVTIYVPAEKIEEYKHAENWSEYADRIIGYSDTKLPDGKYKQTAEKNGTYYTRFVFVVPRTDFAGKSKALFTATYNGTDYTYETSTYYTGVISNGVTYNPASSSDRAMFVVTITSGSDISADLTCKLDFE